MHEKVPPASQPVVSEDMLVQEYFDVIFIMVIYSINKGWQKVYYQLAKRIHRNMYSSRDQLYNLIIMKYVYTCRCSLSQISMLYSMQVSVNLFLHTQLATYACTVAAGYMTVLLVVCIQTQLHATYITIPTYTCNPTVH